MTEGERQAWDMPSGRCLNDPRITFVSVGWTSANGEESVVSLDEMRKHCRESRVQNLVGDLLILCEDVQQAWDDRRNGNYAIRIPR